MDFRSHSTFAMVEVTGFEPATFWSRTKRATKLRYTSMEALPKCPVRGSQDIQTDSEYYNKVVLVCPAISINIFKFFCLSESFGKAKKIYEIVPNAITMLY